MFHDKAGELKGHASGAKKLVGENATNYFFIAIYAIISFTVLAIEYTIKVTHLHFLIHIYILILM